MAVFVDFDSGGFEVYDLDSSLESCAEACVDVLKNEPLSADLERLLERDLSVEVLLVDDAFMRGVNFKERGKDATTDTLSFPVEWLAVHSVDSDVGEIGDFVGDSKTDCATKNAGSLESKTCPQEREIKNYIFIGSILISYEMARQVAHERKHSLNDEIQILFIHSFLHLLGFDHETDSGTHRNLESKIASKLNLPQPLIMRSCYLE